MFCINWRLDCTSNRYYNDSRYSRASDNGPSEKRTTSLQRTSSVLRIEISIVVILKQPPRSGRFSIPDSGQNSNSQRDFSIQNCLPIADKQETTPIKWYGHAHKMLGPRPCITRRLDLLKEDVDVSIHIHAIINTPSLSKQLGIQAVYLYFKISPTKNNI